MLISREKRRTNIIEYLLYMYQIEDIIRSFKFDLSQLDSNIVQRFDQPNEVKLEIKKWYAELIEKMQRQQLQQSGHLRELKEVKLQLQDLHDQLLTTYQDQTYIDLYETARPSLKELTVKSVGQDLINQVDVAVHGVYGFLVMRLKQKEISEQTQSAITGITSFLAHLAVQFHKMEAGELKLPATQQN
ncbi:MAG: hypothetical protein ACI9DK_000278 [Vicingaceae bacterium]|jgi:hypothetical protein